MTEVWRPVVGFEAFYEVSDQGRIRSKSRRVRFVSKAGREAWRQTKPKILATQRNNSGYELVHFWVDDRHTAHTVHALLAAAFLGPRPIGHQVCHNDGDKGHNCLKNLRYDTVTENREDSRRHGTLAVGERIAQSKLTAKQVLIIRRMPGRQEDIAARFGMSRRQISRIKRGDNWGHLADA